MLPDGSDAERTLALHPDRTTWPEIARWLDARIPEVAGDPGRTPAFAPRDRIVAVDASGTIRLPDASEPGASGSIPASSPGPPPRT